MLEAAAAFEAFGAGSNLSVAEGVYHHGYFNQVLRIRVIERQKKEKFYGIKIKGKRDAMVSAGAEMIHQKEKRKKERKKEQRIKCFISSRLFLFFFTCIY